MVDPTAIISIPVILPATAKPMDLWPESYTREVVERRRSNSGASAAGLLSGLRITRGRLRKPRCLLARALGFEHFAQAIESPPKHGR